MQIRENISLRPYHTFGIDVQAKYFSSFNSVDQLQELLNYKPLLSEEKMILGGGSNILFTKDFDGVILRNEISGIQVREEADDFIYITAGAGMNWHELVMYAVQNGYAGMENLSLIPGNTGASPMQNIGAYGVEIKDIFHELEAYHLATGTVKKFSLSECEFGYRESVFKRKYRGQFVITAVTYRLSRKPIFHTSYGAIQQELERMGVQDLSIAAISQAVINIRSSKLPDPKQIGNAGSFFKNPTIDQQQFDELKKRFPEVPSFPFSATQVKVPAGWLIEHSGPDANSSWKGYRVGDAGCYPKQALVLVNYGSATGKDVYDLSEQILHSVMKKYNVQLEREVNIV